MATRQSAALLKRSLLFAWAIWFTIVALTNIADAAQTLGFLSDSWTFASGNFRFVSQTTARHGVSTAVNAILFVGVILWEVLAATLFWRAAAKPSDRSARLLAFTASLLLWSAFMIADEIFIAYAVEGTHLRLFIAQLLTLLAVELIPELERRPINEP